MGQGLQRRTDRLLEYIAREPLKGAWSAAAAITLIVTVAAGLLIRLTDPDTFGSVWQGLWWAIQTTTTVGYGDLVPQSTPGRAMAALVMIAGIGFITVSTAAIASAFVESARRRRERAGQEADDGPDLTRVLEAQAAELRALRTEVATLSGELRSLRGPDGGRA